MADLNVQPKSKSPWWLWLLLILIAAGVLYFFLHKNDHNTSGVAASKALLDTAHLAAVTEPDWESVDFNTPDTRYDELTDKSITVNGMTNTRSTLLVKISSFLKIRAHYMKMQMPN